MPDPFNMSPAVNAIRYIAPVQPVSEPASRWPSFHAAFSGLDTLVPGQSVQGRVLSLTGGEATVMIGTQPVLMELPVKAAVGDTLQLVFSGNNPRPVFLLAATDHPRQTATHFSEAAALLGELTALIQDRQAPASIPGQTTLLDEAPLSPATLAMGLKTGLEKSGLFYESHLGSWLQGNYSLVGLMQEPQARLSAALLPHEALADPDHDAHSGRLLIENRLASEMPGAAEARTLITQQLQLLENNRLVWRGDVWPGQAMQWEVARERDEENPHHTEVDVAAANWTTRIALDLPRLGKITLNLRLDAHNHFDVRLAAQDKDAAVLMERSRHEVMQNIQTAGGVIQHFSVEKNGHA